ncbi:Uncharacterised protein [Serratia marcescens]|nr:Uncharacterised protein [Serratia marcescens]
MNRKFYVDEKPTKKKTGTPIFLYSYIKNGTIELRSLCLKD